MSFLYFLYFFFLLFVAFSHFSEALCGCGNINLRAKTFIPPLSLLFLNFPFLTTKKNLSEIINKTLARRRNASISYSDNNTNNNIDGDNYFNTALI